MFDVGCFFSQSSWIISQFPEGSALLVHSRWAQAELDLVYALAPGPVRLRGRKGAEFILLPARFFPTPAHISGMCLLVGSLDPGMEFPSGWVCGMKVRPVCLLGEKLPRVSESS